MFFQAWYSDFHFWLPEVSFWAIILAKLGFCQFGQFGHFFSIWPFYRPSCREFLEYKDFWLLKTQSGAWLKTNTIYPHPKLTVYQSSTLNSTHNYCHPKILACIHHQWYWYWFHWKEHSNLHLLVLIIISSHPMSYPL